MTIQADIGGQARESGAVGARRSFLVLRLGSIGRFLHDPRGGQILALSSLALTGYLVLGFASHPLQPLVALSAALGVQAIACQVLRVRFDPLSPAITALSLSILLRTDALIIAAMAAAIAVGSKFVFRWSGRHLFNPAALALVLAPLIAPALGAAAWVSPGQWGALGLWAVLIAGVGATVAGRAARLDTTLAFLAAWSALIFGQALYYADPLAIPLRQLQTGAILIFAFHMISDPATTPRRRSARILHAALVALLGFVLQKYFVTETGPILALVLLAPALPLLDWFSARWSSAAPGSHQNFKQRPSFGSAASSKPKSPSAPHGSNKDLP